MENVTQKETQPVTATDRTHPHTRRTLTVATGANEKSVRLWVKKAGVTGVVVGKVERFTNEQRDLILAHNTKAKKITQVAAIDPPATPEITVEAGNHRTSSELSTDVSRPISLAKFRGNQTVSTLALPDEDMTNLEEIALSVMSAMDDDLALQNQALQETQAKIARTKAIRSQLTAKAQTYEMTSIATGMMQNSASAQLDTEKNELDTLVYGPKQNGENA